MRGKLSKELGKGFLLAWLAAGCRNETDCFESYHRAGSTGRGLQPAYQFRINGQQAAIGTLR